MNDEERYREAAEAFIKASLAHEVIAKSFSNSNRIPEHLRGNIDPDTLKEMAKESLIK